MDLMLDLCPTGLNFKIQWWMDANKIVCDKDSSSLFIDSDEKKILTDTLYNTIGYLNMGFSPDQKVHATYFRIIQSACLNNASSRTDLPSIVHNHSGPTVEKHNRSDKSLQYQKGSAMLHPEFSVRATESETDVLQED